jgi:hypothetical protein
LSRIIGLLVSEKIIEIIVSTLPSGLSTTQPTLPRCGPTVPSGIEGRLLLVMRTTSF